MTFIASVELRPYNGILDHPDLDYAEKKIAKYTPSDKEILSAAFIVKDLAGKTLGELICLGNQGSIDFLHIEPFARGTKVGSLLIHKAMEWGKKLGLMGVQLYTMSFQAPGFYDRIGFSKVATINDWWAPGMGMVYYNHIFGAPLRLMLPEGNSGLQIETIEVTKSNEDLVEDRFRGIVRSAMNGLYRYNSEYYKTLNADRQITHVVLSIKNREGKLQAVLGADILSWVDGIDFLYNTILPYTVWSSSDEAMQALKAKFIEVCKENNVQRARCSHSGYQAELLVKMQFKEIEPRVKTFHGVEVKHLELIIT